MEVLVDFQGLGLYDSSSLNADCAASFFTMAGRRYSSWVLWLEDMLFFPLFEVQQQRQSTQAHATRQLMRRSS
jgi:hypothetical protein